MRDKIYNKKSEKYFILGLNVVCLILAFFVIRDILGILVMSGICAYFLFPMYEFFLRKVDNERIAALLTLGTGTFVFLVPIVLIFYFLVLNLVKLVLQYQIYIENPEILNEVLRDFFEKFVNSNILSSFDFSELFNTFVIYVLNFTKDFTSGIPNAILYFFIALFISYYILIHNKKVLKSFNEYIPLSYKKQDEILTAITKNLKVLFKGYFLTGLIQTIVAFMGYVVFGAPNLLIITFLTLITSFIPYLGTPIIWVPVAFYMIVAGNSFGGVALVLYGTFIVSMVDNFVRPVLMSNKETISPPMVFIGLVGGLFAFGIVGIILGPMIISITMIFLRYLVKYFQFKHEQSDVIEDKDLI